ncbi:hypothetical protein [Haloarcula brevis]|uniref:hypothetical protein n=1 Tax=Haloarcula brevis TaxID=3111453 RepID=UPI00300E8CA5
MRYEKHMRIGVAAHAVAVVVFGLSTQAGLPPVVILGAAGGSLPATLIGAAAPDLDEPNSKPYRYFLPTVTWLVIGVSFVVLHVNLRHLVTLTNRFVSSPLAGPLAGEAAVVLPLLLGCGTYLLLPELLQKMDHRGLCHQIPTGVVVSVGLYSAGVTLLAAARAPYPLLVSGVFAGSFLIGFCSHLYADGLLRERRVYIGQSLDQALDAYIPW